MERARRVSGPVTSQNNTFTSTPATARRLIAAVSILVGAALCAYSQTTDTTDLIGRLTSDLSQGKATAFLAHFDQKMPDYARFEAFIYAITVQDYASSSVQVIKDEGDASVRNVELDWILEVTDRESAALTEVRHEMVKCRLEHRGKRWIVTSISPVSFFAPSKR